VCVLETRNISYRCNQAICDFADALYPDMPTTTSANCETVEPTGILMLKPDQLQTHIASHGAVVLRHSITSDTYGYAGINFGASKGNTFEHVVIFPTEPIRAYLKNGNPSVLPPSSRSKLYVAVTRAKHSVAFVV
jgi:hypothetical protein